MYSTTILRQMEQKIHWFYCNYTQKLFFSLFPFTLNPSISNKNIFFFENQYALYALRYIHHNHINWMTILFFLCWMCLLLMMICCLSWNFSFTLDIIMSFFFRFALLNSHHSKFSVVLYVFVCTSVYRRL